MGLTANVGAGGVDFVRRVLDELAQTAEPGAAAALARRNGSDHVVWSPQDRGYCDEIGAQPAWMRRLVWVTLVVTICRDVRRAQCQEPNSATAACRPSSLRA